MGADGRALSPSLQPLWVEGARKPRACLGGDGEGGDAAGWALRALSRRLGAVFRAVTAHSEGQVQAQGPLCPPPTFRPVALAGSQWEEGHRPHHSAPSLQPLLGC